MFSHAPFQPRLSSGSPRLSVRVPSLQAERKAGVLELSLGHPGKDLLPRALLESMVLELSGGDVSLLQYGAEPGDQDFREALAQFLSAAGGVETPSERLFITAGASQALDLFCTLYTHPGDVVLVEEPTYHLALELFKDHGLSVESVCPNLGEGRAEALEAALEERRPKMLYLVPSYANPNGATLSSEARRRVLESTSRYGTWLVADEVYRFLNFSGAPLSTLAQPEAERVLSLGSFSKILAPGLRLGWLEAAPAVVARLAAGGLLRSGGGLNPFASALTRAFLQGGLASHLQRLRQTYQERAAALTGALRRTLPDARFTAPEGGYFIWLEVPGRDSTALLVRAAECGVSYHPGPLFSAQGGFRSHLRLSFAHYPPTTLEDAARRLARAFS